MLKFLRDVFSSSDSASFSRLGSFLALIHVIELNTYLIHKKDGRMPTPLELAGEVGFVAGLYGIGKYAEIQKAKAAQ
jgi:hypothetical protein